MNMQFVSTQNNKTQNINMMRIPTIVRNTNITTAPQIIPIPPTEKKMEWGEPTWFMLHTLAEKVKDDYFDTVCKELLQTIYSICSNLPCPMCAEHAIEYIKHSNFFRITSKKDLKQFLCIFHNVINKKKNYPQFDINLLTDKYSYASTKPIIYNFLEHFQKRNKNMKMLANDMYRMRIVNGIKQWLSINIIYFDD